MYSFQKGTPLRIVLLSEGYCFRIVRDDLPKNRLLLSPLQQFQQPDWTSNGNSFFEYTPVLRYIHYAHTNQLSESALKSPVNSDLWGLLYYDMERWATQCLCRDRGRFILQHIHSQKDKKAGNPPHERKRMNPRIKKAGEYTHKKSGWIPRIKRAGDGNRTHVSSLEGWCSTIELHPHKRYEIGKSNAQNRNRTSDTRIFSPLLYQLSYLGSFRREPKLPATSVFYMTTERMSRYSYEKRFSIW